jgi:tRNA(fMet)-specific endonuclease VapC
MPLASPTGRSTGSSSSSSRPPAISRAAGTGPATAVDSLLATIPVEPYDIEVAKAHAALLVHTRREGRTRGAHDLLIAATARARSRTVVTADAAGFDQLREVGVRLLPANR